MSSHVAFPNRADLSVVLPQLVTPEEAADYLGISAYTVRERLKRGELPGRKHGSRWLVRVVDLAAYVEPNNLKTQEEEHRDLRGPARPPSRRDAGAHQWRGRRRGA